MLPYLMKFWLSAPSRHSLFSVASANSALKSPYNPNTQLCLSLPQPNHFPLFPHPVNIAHTTTRANPLSSIVYFILLCIPRGMRTSSPIRSTPTTARLRNSTATPLNATLTKKQGGSPSITLPRPRYSLLTLPINPLHYAFEANHDS